MATVGGDILEVRVSHPTLGDHVFYPKANEGNTFDPGGIRSDDDASRISGDGQPIWQMNRVRGSFEMVVADDMNEREDSLFAKELHGSPVDGTWTISLINGTIWGMVGRPVGDLNVDTNASTFTLKVAGPAADKIAG